MWEPHIWGQKSRRPGKKGAPRSLFSRPPRLLSPYMWLPHILRRAIPEISPKLDYFSGSDLTGRVVHLGARFKHVWSLRLLHLGGTNDFLSSDFPWWSCYSSRSVRAGSILAMLSVGTRVARSVTTKSVSTTARMVVRSYTPTP